MDEHNTSFAQYEDLLKEGCAPIFGMRILQYFSPDGELRFSLATQGDVHVTQMLGLLDLIMFEVKQRASQ